MKRGPLHTKPWEGGQGWGFLPLDGASGLPPDTTISMTFSKKMDIVTVEAAFSVEVGYVTGKSRELDHKLAAAYRADAAGLGSQTMMNEALRKFLGKPYRVAANGLR